MMLMYNLNNYTLDQCIAIVHAYRMQIRSSVCPDVRNDYMQARSDVIHYMYYKWPDLMAK